MILEEFLVHSSRFNLRNPSLEAAYGPELLHTELNELVGGLGMPN